MPFTPTACSTGSSNYQPTSQACAHAVAKHSWNRLVVLIVDYGLWTYSDAESCDAISFVWHCLVCNEIWSTECYLSENGLGNEAAELEAELLAELSGGSDSRASYNAYEDLGGRKQDMKESISSEL